MNLTEFKNKLSYSPISIVFTDTISLIDEMYEHTPTAFKNGELSNKANENNGSCKVFAFAQLQNLNQQETLACFGQFYYKDVLENPNGTDHQNIRNFIKHGWGGIYFEGEALKEK